MNDHHTELFWVFFWCKFLNFRSCRGRAVRASDFHTGGPWLEPRPSSSALGQGALSSLPSLSEETLSRRSRV